MVYRALDDPDRLWVRPAEMFVEEVDLPVGGRLPRFERRSGGLLQRFAALLNSPSVLILRIDVPAGAVRGRRDPIRNE